MKKKEQTQCTKQQHFLPNCNKPISSLFEFVAEVTKPTRKWLFALLRFETTKLPQCSEIHQQINLKSSEFSLFSIHLSVDHELFDEMPHCVPKNDIILPRQKNIFKDHHNQRLAR
jgi:hypothetical protein